MLGAIGKLLAFLPLLGPWAAGAASPTFALLMVGDLVFAALCVAGLFGDPRRGP